MKNKVLVVIVALVSLIIITSCKQNNIDKIKEEINSCLESIVVPESVSSNLELLKDINGYTVTWQSNNESVLNSEGVVNVGLEDVAVTLTATISKEEVTLSKNFTVTVIGFNPESVIEDVFSKLNIPSQTSTNIELPDQIDNMNVSYFSSDRNVISTNGVVKQGATDIEVTLKATISVNGVTKTKDFKVIVLANPIYQEIDELISDLNIPLETYENITLPTEFNGVSITWKSSRVAVVSNEGIVNRSTEDYTVLLTATLLYKEVKVTKYYDVTVKGWTNKEKLQSVYDDLHLDSTIDYDLILITSFAFGIIGVWESSNEDVLTNEGIYTYNENVSTVTMKVTIKLGSDEMQKEFELTLLPKQEDVKHHMIIERASDLDQSNFNNVELVNNKLVLKSGANLGTYESNAIETKEFVSLVASWAAVTSKTATVELEVKARVNGVWSNYISYKPWGLGLENACKNQSNSLIKLSIDEVMVLNSKRADAIMYRVTLRSTDGSTPEFSLASFALEIPGYNYPVNISMYPSSLIHDVPLLYQGEVPTIGNSICSATSSTMLLKYKGESFTAFDSQYEHRYIAGIVRDYGNNIYGNWVYNTVAMSAYGYDSYVARFYSINELVEHLATVGPCALSVKGQMTSDIKNYYTNGHLIVAIGYEIKDDGSITIVCNDPNVKGSMCRYSLTVMNNTWRNIAYVIE